jgi:hypothetical protein
LVVESCEDPFKWWKMHELKFLIVGYVANQILGIMGSQIEEKWTISMVRILIGL